jgi:RNA polymerase sigma-70 factor (ECF subfamily)
MDADRQQFMVLVPRHTDAMLHVAAAMLGWQEAEDAVQEAALQAWRHWESLRDPGSIRPWLLRITINVCRQWRRGTPGHQAQMRATAVPLDAMSADDLELLVTLDDSPATSDFARALDVRHAINHLPTEQRIVVALRYYADLDASTIGEILGVPAATIRTRLRRALLALRERLDSAMDTPTYNVPRSLER